MELIMISKVNKINFFVVLISGALFLSSCHSKQQQQVKKPNVLFLFADDQRAGTINSLGNKEVITPHLDKLASRGISMENTYIMGGSSAAVCAPSRAMMMTGRDLYGIEKQGWRAEISEKNISMPEVFREAGYETFGTGKQHNGKAVFARGFTSGAEIMFGGMSDHWNVPVYHFDSTGKYDKRAPYIQNPGKNNQVEYRWNCDHIQSGKHSSELFADAAIDFIENRDDSKPFFAYVSFTAPHDPRTVPEAFIQMYDTALIEVPVNFLPQHPWDFGEFEIRDELLAGFPRTKAEVKEHLREYYAMITHLDAQVGKIIQALKESGEYENTIIVFSADNGLALGQHGMFGKQNLYEHSIHVPLIICGDGIPQNATNKELCYLYDLFPSLCEMTDIEVPETVMGKSFYSSILNKTNNHRDAMFYAYKEFMRSYREDDFKIIEYYVGEERNSQLFNLKTDPMERMNLLEKEEKIYLHLRTQILTQMEDLNDTGLIYRKLKEERFQ